MVKVYLIRHGQTMFNAENKIAGQIETDLTELGKKQAQELGKKLKNDNVKFDAIICSTLKRAKDTAGIISKEIDVPVFYDVNLVEFSNGIYEGVVVDDLKKLQFNPPYKTAGFEFFNGADLYNAYSSFDECYNQLSYPKGETKVEARERFMGAIKKYISENPNVENLGVVAHGAVIRFMLLKICPDLLKEKIKNAEARVVSYDKKQGIFKVNDN